MSNIMDGRCVACRRDGLLFEMQWAEPKSADDARPVLVRGWVCDDCAIVHWARPPQDFIAPITTTDTIAIQTPEKAPVWICPKGCGHSRVHHICTQTPCTRGCHAHDGSDGPCDCLHKETLVAEKSPWGSWWRRWSGCLRRTDVR